MGSYAVCLQWNAHIRSTGACLRWISNAISLHYLFIVGHNIRTCVCSRIAAIFNQKFQSKKRRRLCDNNKINRHKYVQALNNNFIRRQTDSPKENTIRQINRKRTANGNITATHPTAIIFAVLRIMYYFGERVSTVETYAHFSWFYGYYYLLQIVEVLCGRFHVGGQQQRIIDFNNEHIARLNFSGAIPRNNHRHTIGTGRTVFGSLRTKRTEKRKYLLNRKLERKKL